MLERMALTAGASVLEIGCGPGCDVMDPVDTVGHTGRLVGLDASEAMIAEAGRRAAARSAPVTFEVGGTISKASRVAADNETGTRMALANLPRYVERVDRDG